MQIHNMKLPRGGGYLSHLNDPFHRGLEDLRVVADLGEELVACHIDLTSAFWLVVLPPRLQGSFQVRIDGNTYAFSGLPFGWQFPPLIEGTLARQAKFSHALVWPLELGLRTPTLQCSQLSGPLRRRGGFFHFEVGGHDGAYKGRVHVIVPFIGRKKQGI